MSINLTGSGVLAACDALGRYSERPARLLRQAEDPNAPAVGVWNIPETAVHVSGSSRYFLEAGRGLVAREELEARRTVLSGRMIPRGGKPWLAARLQSALRTV